MKKILSILGTITLIGVNDNHLGKTFSFYPSDSDGILDTTTVRDNVIKFTIGAGGALLLVPTAVGTVTLACAVDGSAV